RQEDRGAVSLQRQRRHPFRRAELAIAPSGSTLARCDPLSGRKRPAAKIPVGASSDRYALAIGNRRGTLQHIVGNVEGEDVGFGLTGYVAVHDTRPIEALTGKPNRYLPWNVPRCPASQPRKWLDTQLNQRF